MLPALFLTACLSPETASLDTAAPAAPLPTLTLGSTEDGWALLDDGDPLTMVHGPAGGWTFQVGVHLTGFDSVVELEVQATATELGHVTLCNHPYRVKTTPHPDDPAVATFTEMFCYLDVRALVQGDLDTPYELLAGQEVEVHVDAFDALGTGAHESVTIIAQPDPEDVD